MIKRPSLETVFSAADGLRLTDQLNITFSGGRWQVSMRRPGTSAYKIVVEDSLIEAIYGALGPNPKQSWEDHLRLVPEDDDFSHLI